MATPTALTLYATKTTTGNAAKLSTSSTTTATATHLAASGTPGGFSYHSLALGTHTGWNSNWTTEFGTPGGRGAVFATTTLSGKAIVPGSWSLTLKVHKSGTNPVTLVGFRVWRKNGSTYTLVGVCTTGSHVLSKTATTYTLTGTLPAASFGSSTRLYIDVLCAATTTNTVYVAVGSSYAKLVTPGYITPTAPSAPTLQTPVNGKYETLGSGVTFVAQYHSTDGYAQNAYALRVKTTTSATFKYWNATTGALQSSEVWNTQSTATGASWSVTLPASVVRNGTVYHWSMASRESTGTVEGPFASTFAFTAAAPPAVTVTAPTGSVLIPHPTIRWTATPGPPTSITAFRVVVYTKAQHTSTTFTPGGSPNVWDSGTVSGSTSSVEVGVELPNNTTFYAYVQVTQDPTQKSAWAYTSFSTLYEPPQTPTITAETTSTPTTGAPMVTLKVQCHTNVLTLTSASFGEGLGKWAAGSNTTLTKVDPPVSNAHATGTMKLTPSAAGALNAHTAATASNAFVVVGGQTYTIMGTVLAGVDARLCTLKALWRKATGTLISTVTVATGHDSTSAWSQLKGQETAPATAERLELELTVASVSGTSDVHYATVFAACLGEVSTWSEGGFVGHQTVEIIRSDGYYVRNASNLNQLAVTTPTQTATVNDYEAVPSTEYTYAAKVVIASLNQVSTSGTSSAVTLTTTEWWEIPPTTPAMATQAQPVTVKPQVTEQSTAHLVMGQAYPNVVANAMGGQDGTAVFETFTGTVFSAFQAILQSQKTIFLSNPFGTADNTPRYVRFGPQSGGLSSGMGNKVKTSTLLPSTSAAPHHTTAVTWVAQPRPPV